jgi:hypothetical protein
MSSYLCPSVAVSCHPPVSYCNGHSSFNTELQLSTCILIHHLDYIAAVILYLYPSAAVIPTISHFYCSCHPPPVSFWPAAVILRLYPTSYVIPTISHFYCSCHPSPVSFWPAAVILHLYPTSYVIPTLSHFYCSCHPLLVRRKLRSPLLFTSCRVSTFPVSGQETT